MTDEEMAKEYSKSACAWIEDREPLDERDIQQAFFAGLKEGRRLERKHVKNNAFTSMKEQGLFPMGKWHKVADRDLPKEEQLGKSFTVAFAFNEMTHEYYSFDCAEYIDKGKFCTHTNNDDKVIAWREIQ